MKINRNSWHYKVYEFGHASEEKVPETTNLCRYFWRCWAGVGFGLMILTLLLALTAGACVVLYLLGLATFFFPIETGTITAGAVAIYFLRKYRKPTEPREPGLLRLYLQAKKEKVCPIIEFEG